MTTKHIFQLGTNNWQRQDEYAPGSGILHETHHMCYNSPEHPDMQCWSVFPSKIQSAENETYRVFPLAHDIPICESISPVSSYRWHTMSDAEFDAYRTRLETFVYDFMAEIEADNGGAPFEFCVAHHSFLNPIIMRNVIARRVSEGKPETPLFCQVHGTALKMYVHELSGLKPVEFPPRFHALLTAEGIFDGTTGILKGCFVTDAFDQKSKLLKIFPKFPEERIIVASNGVNQRLFTPTDDTLNSLITEQIPADADVHPAAGSAEHAAIAKCARAVVFCGKFANWKRLDALLYAAAAYEKTHDDVATIIIGSGPPDDVVKYREMATTLGLTRTLFTGPQPQPLLAKFFAAANVCVFPSYAEPFGMVFIEAMACGTPVIGACSGGPKDFITTGVGELCPEPGSYSTADCKALGASIDVTVTRALAEDWNTTKRAECLRLSSTEYSVSAQVATLLKGIARVSALKS